MPERGTQNGENLLARGAFTVSMAEANQVVPCDYVGIVSGNKEADKVAKAGFHTTKSSFVDAPLIDELAMALECTVVSYDAESGCLIGEIVNVCADERAGRRRQHRSGQTQPIVFDPVKAAYRVLGEKVGNAFSDGKQLR